MKKLNANLKNVFFYCEICCKKIIPHTPFKVRSDKFAPCNTSIMANKLPSTNLEQFLRHIKSLLTYISGKYIARYLSQIGQNFIIQTPIT